jgi:hypothetical protein
MFTKRWKYFTKGMDLSHTTWGVGNIWEDNHLRR